MLVFQIDFTCFVKSNDNHFIKGIGTWPPQYNTQEKNSQVCCTIAPYTPCVNGNTIMSIGLQV